MFDEEQTLDRRARENARRDARRRRSNVIGTVATVLVIVLVALVATDTIRLHGVGPTLASGKTKPPPATTASSVGAIQPSGSNLSTTVRPLSNAAPLRLWTGGDSLAGDLGYQLGPMLGQTGIVKPHVDYKVSSGLASNAVRDWPSEFLQEEVQYAPEVTVFMIGANDATIVSSAKDSTGQPAWEAKYRAKVDRMMNLLVGPTRRPVYWIGTPPLGTQYNHGAQEVNRVIREEAAKHPTVIYVDAYKLFSKDGEYAASLPDAEGNLVRMRTSDGVHLTVAGAEYLAQHVYKLIDRRWNLDTQHALDTPIPYTIEPSSGTIGGVHLRNTNHYTSPTTTPATAAPTTTTHTAPTTAAPTTTVHTGSTTTVPSSTTTAP